MSEFNQNEPNNFAEGEVEYEEEERNEEIEESSDDFDAGAIKNKFETREIEDIQQEIQNVTKKIEHEKINLRITEERYEKTKNEYNKLQGKTEVKTKEDKEKERKEKKEKQKIKIEDQKKEPKQQNKHQILNETAKKKFFELMKQESEIDSLTKQINQVNLDCEDLKQQIEYLRKQKNSNETQLNDINKKNDKLTKDTKKLKEKNLNTNKNID
jgi:chromosome segregation ATPase